MYLLVHFYLRVCCANTLLLIITDILVRSDTLRINFCAARSSCAFSVSLLQIGGADARSLAEIKRRRTFCTSSIFSSGTDAAGLNRSDISALPKFAMKSVHGRTLFMMQRSRCAAYLQKLFFPDLKNPRLLPQLFDKFIGRRYFQLRRALDLIDGIVIGNMDKNIAGALRAEEEILERLEL